jgi:hypothetical protein
VSRQHYYYRSPAKLQYPINNKAQFFFPVVLFGFLDLATTIAGISFGAAEANPLFSGLTQTNMGIFIGIKSSTILLTGFLFYKAASVVERSDGSSSLGLRFLRIGYLVALILLVFVVANNMLIIFQCA